MNWRIIVFLKNGIFILAKGIRSRDQTHIFSVLKLGWHTGIFPGSSFIIIIEWNKGSRSINLFAGRFPPTLCVDITNERLVST